MSRIAFTNARLLDGESAARGPLTLVIKGNRIESISEDPRTADGATQKIDAGGRTIMPGMIMGHYHATYKELGSIPVPSGLEAPPALQALRAAQHMGLLLDHGFTSAIGAGSPWAIDASLKLAIAEGALRGPRVVAGSRDVSNTGHGGDWHPWYWGLPREVIAVNRCDGADEMRRGVREEIQRGADIIKVFASAGHGVPGFIGGIDLTDEELRAGADAAHQRGALIRAHVSNKLALLKAFHAGFDILDHADGLDEECVDLIAPTNVVVMPSLVFLAKYAELMAGTAIADRVKADIENMLRILPIANRAGVKLAVGDDYGAMGFPHINFGAELEYYVNVAGIPALDVIKWATVNGAHLVDRGKGPGALKVGAIADLLLVDGDPVADIKLLRNGTHILAIVKDGVFQKHPPQNLNLAAAA